MAAQTWLDSRDGILVVHKRFLRDGGSDAEDRHRAEYRWLRRAARHPMTQVVDVDHDHLTMTTRFAGGATALSTPRPPLETARLLSAAARALGSLHRHHLVHGKLDGNHIVVNGPRFVLCSPSGLLDDPALDVAAFGPLIELLCQRWEASPRHENQRFDRWREVGRAAAAPGLSADRLAARLSALAEA